MKNYLAKSSLLGYMLLLFVSWSSVSEPAESAYSVTKPIYPVIFAAMKNGTPTYWKKATIELYTDNINNLIIHDIYAADGLLMAYFDMKISLVHDKVTYECVNIRLKSPTSNDPERNVKNFTFFKPSIITTYFNKELERFMNDEAAYEAAKKEADAVLLLERLDSKTVSAKLENPNALLVYPALPGAVSKMKVQLGSAAVLSEIDCLDNSFKIRKCVATQNNREKPFIYYDIEVLAVGNSLTYNFTNIRDSDILLFDKSVQFEYKGGKVVSNQPDYAPETVAAVLTNHLQSVLADKQQYDESKLLFFKDNNMVSLAIKPITSLLRDEFISTVLQGQPLTFNSRIFEVSENTNKKYPAYKYHLSGALFAGDNSVTFKSIAGIDFYTNKAEYARLKNGAEIALTGTVVDLEDKTITKNIILTD